MTFLYVRCGIMIKYECVIKKNISKIPNDYKKKKQLLGHVICCIVRIHVSTNSTQERIYFNNSFELLW